MSEPHAFCSILSAEANEPLLGTASRNAFHFVLAIPKREWLAAIEEMPGPAGTLSSLIKPAKDQAILSLRNCEEAEKGTLWLFPHGYRFEHITAAEYPALVEQVLNGNIQFHYHTITDQTFVLVCTHGKRDACCAKHGIATLEALREQAPAHAQVWEVSHLGGHRFAATLVVQPGGRWYGRLRAEDAPALWQAIQQRKVLLSHYRGKANYPPPLQVAEAWAWEHLIDNGQNGKINLVNPLIDGLNAQVEVSLNIEGRETRIALTLAAENYIFTADCDGTQKDRLIWKVIKAERMVL